MLLVDYRWCYHCGAQLQHFNKKCRRCGQENFSCPVAEPPEPAGGVVSPKRVTRWGEEDERSQSDR